MTQNLAPTSGTLTILPDQGHVLQTVFQLSAEQWVDPKLPEEDYPLSFSFGYIDFSGFSKLLVSDWKLRTYKSEMADSRGQLVKPNLFMLARTD